MTTAHIYTICAAVWLGIGLGFHWFLQKAMRRALNAAIEAKGGIPYGQLPVWVRVFFALVDALMGPIGPIVFLTKFAWRLWKDRARTKAWLFGYWPLVAHSTNLIGHWLYARDEFKANVSSDAFFMVDSHFAELAQCLKENHKVSFEQNPVEYLDGIPGVNPSNFKDLVGPSNGPEEITEEKKS